jgi:enoyl-CoA hydratase
MSFLINVTRQATVCRWDVVRTFASASTYQHIVVERKGAKNNVALVRLNRPKALNALCGELMSELACALRGINNDKGVHAIVLTGSERAFAGR